MKPSIQFVKRKDGVKIAYSIFGEGPPLVISPQWVTSLPFVLEDPFMNQFLERLAKYMTIVFYDKHGCGQSDRDRKIFTLETELLDIETVIDHLGLVKFNLFGSSMAGPITIAYTVRYPKRVTNLILYGTFAAGKNLSKKEVQSALISLVRASWGLGSKAFADIFIPGANKEEIDSLARFQRVSASPEITAKMLELCYSFDVTEVLSEIKTPTLILHREGDKAISIQHGRQLASDIPGARFKVLSGQFHPPWWGESNEITKEIINFVGKEESTVFDDEINEFSNDESKIVEQATIVFTDIVSSTVLVTKVGDAAARDLFLKHDKIVRNQLKKYGGKELQNLGDGFMLSFASASAAIKCACKIQQQISEALPSIQVRIGINTGEVVRREAKHPFGQAVVVASRIVSECKGGQILVSDVTKQLTAGSVFSFIERRSFQPKGFNESIKLFEVGWAK
jgi:class 3 adenylate cyclase/pimeloyl-ACP methyl ester carboxylesterase